MTGIILVLVQLRFIGPWSARLGDRGLVKLALALLALGTVADRPDAGSAASPFTCANWSSAICSAPPCPRTEAVIGELGITLPPNGGNSLAGRPLAVCRHHPHLDRRRLDPPRPLNSLITQRVKPADFGSALGVSAALVSAGNATAPLIAGLLFQRLGAAAPFLLGGVLMAGLCLWSVVTLRGCDARPTQQTCA